ncbi:Rho guanine nucleotide exchange factor, partial [Marasmius crinis-equi]
MAASWNAIGAEQAAQEYETRLKHLEKILDDEEQRKALVQSKGDDAQAWLDFLQLLSDYPGISIPLRSSVFSIMIRLAKNSGLHPKCLSIQNVKKVGNHPVGGGGFGDVWEGVVEDPTLKHSVCLKVVRMFRESDVERLLQDYLREAIVWRQLRHRNVLPFLGIYFLDESRQQVCLVSPWMEKGNLVQFLKTTPPEAVEHLALAHDVASGLAYLHYMKIVHGDLKGLNILITTALRACIADFGLSRVSDTHALRMTTSANHPLGTARWLSPELLQGGTLTSKESDVYAYACVCYEIFTGLSPFHEIPNEMAVALQVLAGRRPLRPQSTPGIPDAMWSLMEECWAAQPSSRPRADDVLIRFARASNGDFTPIASAPEWNDSIFTQMWSSVDRPSPSITRPEFDRLLSMTPMVATQIVAQLPMPYPSTYPVPGRRLSGQRRTTGAQRKALEGIFKHDTKLNAALRNELATQLNMTARGVQVWFQNRRAKEKAKVAKVNASANNVPSASNDTQKYIYRSDGLDTEDNTAPVPHVGFSRLSSIASVASSDSSNTSVYHSCVSEYEPSPEDDGPPLHLGPFTQRRSLDASLRRLGHNPYAGLVSPKYETLTGPRISNHSS